MNKKVLHLHVKSEYFNQIKSGKKIEEFRSFNGFWCARLFMRTYDEIHILKGYPRKGDPDRIIVFPWNGYNLRTITHKQFGIEPVDVYAIRLFNKVL